MKKLTLLLLTLVLAACGQIGLDGQVIPPTAPPTPTLPPTAPPTPTLVGTPDTDPGPTPVSAASATPSLAPSLLPAPLYFISARNNQIWRMEPDGATRTQITHELEPVTELDVSPADGALVYVSNNQLIQAAADGTDRKVLVDGGWADPQDPAARYTNKIVNPRWRPNGEEIVFGQAGVNFIAAGGAGGPQQVLASSPYPAAGTMPSNEVFYEPVGYSPDGRWLLVSKAFFPEGGEYLLLLLNTDAQPITLRGSTGSVCCQFAWADQALYVANHYLGMFDVGLWRAELPSGDLQPVVSNDFGTSDQPIHFAGFPFGGGGALFAFAAERLNTPEAFQTQTLLTLSRVAQDGALVPLRTDQFLVGEALGAPDGSGAVIVDISANPNQYPPFVSGALRWLAASDTPAVDLQVEAGHLRWGK